MIKKEEYWWEFLKKRNDSKGRKGELSQRDEKTNGGDGNNNNNKNEEEEGIELMDEVADGNNRIGSEDGVYNIEEGRLKDECIYEYNDLEDTA
jgi:hypothetical protein